MKMIIFLSLILAGCSSLILGNYVDTRLIEAMPDDINICIRSTDPSPSYMNANDTLVRELAKLGIPTSCKPPSLKASWSYDIGNKETSIFATPSQGSSSSASSCAGGACSGGSSGSFAPGFMSNSTSYERKFLLNVYDQDPQSGNPKSYWKIELSSRGEITNIGKLILIWSPIIAEKWGESVTNKFVPNSGINILLD